MDDVIKTLNFAVQICRDNGIKCDGWSMDQQIKPPIGLVTYSAFLYVNHATGVFQPITSSTTHVNAKSCADYVLDQAITLAQRDKDFQDIDF